MRAQSIAEPPSNDRRAIEPGLYMLMKCHKTAVRRKLRDRYQDLFSAFEIFDHTGNLCCLGKQSTANGIRLSTTAHVTGVVASG